MAKQQLYAAEAERLYVIEQMTVNEIASRLSLAEKTVRNWIEANGWKEKKSNYLKERKSFHEELYQFTRKMMKSITTDLEEGKPIDTGRLYTLTRLIPNILKVQDYESIVAQHKATGEDKPASQDEIVKLLRRSLGIE